MDRARYCLYSSAGVWVALFAMLLTSHASIASGGPKSSPSRLRVPLDDIICLWSAPGGENFAYPGGGSAQSFGALLWSRTTYGNHSPPDRVLALAVRRSNKFLMVQLAGSGLVSYTASDGAKFRSLLFDPRGNGTLMAARTKGPLVGTFFGVASSQYPGMFEMAAIKGRWAQTFRMSLSRVLLRLVSRHCNRLSYDGRDRILTIRTLTPQKNSRIRFAFSSWPTPGAPQQLGVIVSAIDMSAALARQTFSLHVRLSPPGPFPTLPGFTGGSSQRAIGLKIKRIDRSDFVARYSAAFSAAGPFSARAVAARRRFLNWAVGRKEASVLDGWINKGIAPMRPAAQAVKGGTK